MSVRYYSVFHRAIASAGGRVNNENSDDCLSDITDACSVFSRTTTDPHVLIEKQHRDYLNAFSQRDVEKIERYFGYPLFSTAIKQR